MRRQTKGSMGRKAKGKDSAIFKHGMIFLAGSGITAVLNYLYHLFMGRMLGPYEYGILGSLFALIYIATTATGAFNLTISKYTAQFKGKEKESEVKYLVSRALKKVSVYGIIILAIYVLLSQFIASFMNLESATGVVIVGVAAFFMFISSILSGTLNGFQKFVWQNASSISSVIIKFSLAVILVAFGFGVNGALGAVLLGTVMGIAVSSIPLKKTFKKTKSESFDARPLYKHLVLIFIGLVFPILIITLDQVLVKHFFISDDAGLYAAAGMIAKIIWFGSGFLIGPLFPKIVSLKARKKDPSLLLKKALIYTVILAGLGSLAYFIIPTFIVNMLYGEHYLSIAPLIGLFGIALGLYAVNNIFAYYNLATENYKFIIILAIALVIEMTGIFLFHSSLSDIIKTVFATNLFVTIAFIVLNKKDLGLNGLGSD